MPVIYCRECRQTFMFAAGDEYLACSHVQDAIRKIRTGVAKPGDNAANRLRPDRQGSGATIPAESSKGARPRRKLRSRS